MNCLVKLVSIVIVFGTWAIPSHAAPTVTGTQCGATINSITRTATGTFETASEIPPVLVPGGQITIVVPAGKQRCIRVHFSAAAFCPHACFLRVTDSLGGVFQPRFDVAPSLRFANNTDAEANSFEWILRAGPGAHVVKLFFNTGNTIAKAVVGPYTITFEVTN